MTFSLGLFAADIDGTLVRGDKSLSDAVVAAAQRLIAAGVPMTLISARPPAGMLWIAERIGVTLPVGAFNGGTIVAPGGKILCAERLAADIARRTMALIDRPGVNAWLFAAGRWHARRPDPVHDDRERKSANLEPIYGEDFAGLLGAADKIVAVSDDHALLADVEREVSDALGDEATAALSQPYYLDVTAPAANKGDGIAALAKAAGVPLANVAVIGDQRNDLPMFRRAGLSIAMGQGPEEIRAAATCRTASNDEDGVAQAIETILLPLT